MKIVSIKTGQLFDDVKKQILTCLSSTGQLSTTKYVMKNAQRWFIMKDINGRIMGFIALKKSKDENYDHEIGYAYVNPEDRQKRIFQLLLENIVRDSPKKRLFLTTKEPNLKKYFKKNEKDGLFEYKGSTESKINKDDVVETWANKFISESLNDKNLFKTYIGE